MRFEREKNLIYYTSSRAPFARNCKNNWNTSTFDRTFWWWNYRRAYTPMHFAPFGRETVSRAVKQKEPKAYWGLVRRIAVVSSSTRTTYDDDQSQFSTFLSSMRGRERRHVLVRKLRRSLNHFPQRATSKNTWELE